MARVRNGTRRVLAAGLVLAFAAACLSARSRPAAFAGPLRAAAAAGALIAAIPSDAALAQLVPQAYDMDATSIHLSAKSISMGGQAEGGGLDGLVEMKGKASKKDFVDDEGALAAEEKFEQKFDQYIFVFAILFVGAFIAPMVTYFWYTRDTDPWQN
eukprot:CAMPEP_0171189198 /NCGR_PEP_ID=MMETSP0790-20130122/18222_1 /TAXON_ID=2925 /ORGANISM="Alexandrium catenella, Strain OF101" /LENGTH=156 /DNA_ID=CAMNT_0011654301 /DNA_START=44 /DNA_END=514 /DNA_ORIENTATION=+